MPASAVLGLAIPILFLHVDYQPGLAVDLGAASANVYLSDVAVLAVALTGVGVAVRHGLAPLRAGWPVWAAGGLFLALVAAASAYPRLWDGSYDAATHAVTAAKFAEYGVLALAVPLLVRRPRDLELLLASLLVWTAAAALVGALQIFGVHLAGAWPAGRRQPSFLGHYDLAALSGASLTLALASLALGLDGGRGRRTALAVGGVAGGVGLVVSGSSAGGIGFGAAVFLILAVALVRRRLSVRRAALAAVAVGAVAAGILILRSGDFGDFVRFLGIRQEEQASPADVQTYVQRTLLAYIGWRIFLDHPVAGAGWQASSKEEQVYSRYLADAKREFPEAPAVAFPSPAHPYGTQNAYVQALADLGVIGLALMLATFAAGLALAAKAALAAPLETALPGLVAGAWLLVAMGTWSAVGLVAGLPVDALMWIALGLAAAAATGARLVRA